MTTVAQAQAELASKTQASQRIAEERAEILNSGLAANLEMPHPIFIERGKGPYVFDADDNRYIDTSVGFGLHMLGHAHPLIEAAIKNRSELGWMFGIHSTSQMKLAELLQQASPSADRVVFCNTGSEATMYAFRAARGFSSKNVIGLFDGFYHGAHDYGMWVTNPNSSQDEPQKLPMGGGIPEAIAPLTRLLPYRNRAAFDQIRRYKDELAMVMIEGVQSSNPQPEAGEFLQELAQVCRECEVLFGIDEVITGFRVAYGGVQEKFAVTPDIATYGKVLGGGLPIGAITGRADVMEVFTGLGPKQASNGRQLQGIFSGGTFSGNPLTMEAGAAAVTHLRDNPEIYLTMDAAGDRLAGMTNSYCAANDIPAQMKNVGGMFHMFFQNEPINSMRDVTGSYESAQKAFYLHTLNQGVLVPGTQRAFLSAAHGEAEIDQLVDVFTRSLQMVSDEGLFGR